MYDDIINGLKEIAELEWKPELIPEIDRLSKECLEEDFENETSLSFIETSEFKNAWKKLGLNDEDLRQLQIYIYILKDRNQWIVLGSEAYKIQFTPTNSNRSKSNIDRVFYIHIVKGSKIQLITIIDKSDIPDIDIDKKAQNYLIKLAKELNK